MDDRDLKTRLKDWAATEKEKILGIRGTKKKTAYIWEYYKLWIIGLIFILWFVPFAIHQYRTNAGDYWCYMMFTNTYADAGNGSDLWKDYTEYAEFDLKEKDVEFNAESYFDYLKGVTGNSYFEAFVAQGKIRRPFCLLRSDRYGVQHGSGPGRDRHKRQQTRDKVRSLCRALCSRHRSPV